MKLAVAALVVIAVFLMASVLGHFLLLGGVALAGFVLGNGYGQSRLTHRHRRQIGRGGF